MLVHVAFARVDSTVLHSGEPTYPGEPVVVQLAQVLEVDPPYVFVADADGNVGPVHRSRLYNVWSPDLTDGELELESWRSGT